MNWMEQKNRESTQLQKNTDIHTHKDCNKKQIKVKTFNEQIFTTQIMN